MELSEFMNKVVAAGMPEFLIGNILTPQRFILLPGRTGIGKSILATQLMFCFASGISWIGFTVKSCICLYINLELPDFQLGDRLQKQSVNFKLIHEPRIESHPFRRIPLETTEGLKTLEHMIAMEPKPEVVIIDSFRHTYGGRINNNDQTAIWVNNVQGLMGRYEIGIVVIQNTTKARPFLEVGSIEEGIGASELANRAVSVMVATARQQRTHLGQFGTKSSDEVDLHIPKYGCSIEQLSTIPLKLIRDKLLFIVQDPLDFTPF